MIPEYPLTAFLILKITGMVLYHSSYIHMSRHMGKPTICICENKDADQLRGNLISAFVFATRIVRPPLLNYKISSFQPASVAVQAGLCGPVRKPHCWFSHEVAEL